MKPGKDEPRDGASKGDRARAEAAKQAAVPAGRMSPTGGVRSLVRDEVDGHLLWIGALAHLVPGPYSDGFLGGLVVADSEREDTPAITVNTGIWSGEVCVMTEALARAPQAVEADWEDVVELSVRVDEGPVFVEGGLERDTSAERRLDGHGPGWYRLRVHAVNRDLEEGQEASGPWERYLVQAWPEDGCRDGLVWRERSAVAAMLDDLSDAPDREWGSDEQPRILRVRPDWIEPAPTVHDDRPQIPRPHPVQWEAAQWEELFGEEGPQEPALGLERRYLELLLGRALSATDPGDAALVAAARERVGEDEMRLAVAHWQAPESE